MKKFLAMLLCCALLMGMTPALAEYTLGGSFNVTADQWKDAYSYVYQTIMGNPVSWDSPVDIGGGCYSLTAHAKGAMDVQVLVEPNGLISAVVTTGSLNLNDSEAIQTTSNELAASSICMCAALMWAADGYTKFDVFEPAFSSVGSEMAGRFSEVAQEMGKESVMSELISGDPYVHQSTVREWQLTQILDLDRNSFEMSWDMLLTPDKVKF